MVSRLRVADSAPHQNSKAHGLLRRHAPRNGGEGPQPNTADERSSVGVIRMIMVMIVCRYRSLCRAQRIARRGQMLGIDQRVTGHQGFRRREP